MLLTKKSSSKPYIRLSYNLKEIMRDRTSSQPVYEWNKTMTKTVGTSFRLKTVTTQRKRLWRLMRQHRTLAINKNKRKPTLVLLPTNRTKNRDFHCNEKIIIIIISLSFRDGQPKYHKAAITEKLLRVRYQDADIATLVYNSRDYDWKPPIFSALKNSTTCERRQ